jgi:undecaprenyl-phosphate 4-deoxy-4-formamido-L-arabinose transferase
VSIDALLSWTTAAVQAVTVRHDNREFGVSNYDLRRLLRFAVDVMTNYSDRPLKIAGRIGFLATAAGFGSLLWVLIQFCLTRSSPAGFPYLASVMTLFGGVQLICIGVLGEYLGRMHFRLMKRPSYFVAERIERGS